MEVSERFPHAKTSQDQSMSTPPLKLKKFSRFEHAPRWSLKKKLKNIKKNTKGEPLGSKTLLAE